MWSGSRTVGRSAKADEGDDTTYWCLIGTTGTATPASRPTVPAAAPAAFTITGVSMRPWVVTAARTSPSVVSTESNRTPVSSVAPSSRAPAARARARRAGSR
jgi:hypothetical protein